MARKTTASHTNKDIQTFAFEGKGETFSAFQPIDIKPKVGQDWILNGTNNINFKTYRDAYDDSPTNSAIIDAYVNYTYGEGLIDNVTGGNLKQFLSDEDALLICHDFKTYGGYSLQVIWGEDKKPIKFKYIPIYKLGVRYDMNSLNVTGYWFSYDWVNKYKYTPKFYPIFTGTYNSEQPLQIIVVRRPTAEPFFPVPDYLAGIPWARVEGELGNAAINHFKNGLTALTVINYNQGRQATPELARQEAQKVRDMATGSDNQGKVIVSFNDSMEEAVAVDQLSPPELNQQNVFYAEEAERKLIVAHSAPPILFSGSNQGNGFSNNADEIAVATKMLYRKKINPMREIICRGLKQCFDLINPQIMPWFKDFEEETELEQSKSTNSNDSTQVAPLAVNSLGLDEQTLKAQANLKGSVGGVQALLEIQASYSQGLTTYESAINMLDIIYGYTREQAVRLLGKPKTEVTL